MNESGLIYVLVGILCLVLLFFFIKDVIFRRYKADEELARMYCERMMQRMEYMETVNRCPECGQQSASNMQCNTCVAQWEGMSPESDETIRRIKELNNHQYGKFAAQNAIDKEGQKDPWREDLDPGDIQELQDDITKYGEGWPSESLNAKKPEGR